MARLRRTTTTPPTKRDAEGACPDENAVVAFFRGWLDRDQSVVVEAHVKLCQACRACLIALAMLG